MSKKISITITTLLFTVVLSGCSTHNSISSKEFYYRESILLKANNYPGLITLYRDKLKSKEDDSVRLKLANAYYLT
ncbi:tight adherance operon protein, partial [Yersinia enterocolitica]